MSSTPHLTLDPNPIPSPSPSNRPANEGEGWSEPRDFSRDALAADVGDEIDRLGLGEGDLAPSPNAPASGEMDREKFRDFFYGVFQLSRIGVAAATKTRALDALNVTAATPGAPQAADEAYNLCLKVPAFRPLLRMADNPVMSAFAVTVFVGGVGYGAWRELKPQLEARRAAEKTKAASVDHASPIEAAA